jgi:CubicO group peptidase (beta-lactamase class C family)
MSLISTISYGQKSNTLLEKQIDSLFTNINNINSPGAAVLVIQDGKVLISKGYGMANLEYHIPVTPTSVFDIASLSKHFTGMAISILIEQGKISLQDDISKYIPELPNFGEVITIENLVHHSSGLRDFPSTLTLAGWRMDDVRTFEQILGLTFNQNELNFKPGTEFCYSNTGYILLAELVKRVTGTSLTDWTKNNIFQPLEMKNTFFLDDHTEVIPNKAYGYSLVNDSTFHAEPNNLAAPGPSSLNTTIADYAKWIANFYSTKVGGENVIKRMFEPGKLKNGQQIYYGFGVNISQYKGLPTIIHDGSLTSYTSVMLHFPQQRFSVVILMNYSPVDANKVAYQIADFCLEEQFEVRSLEANVNANQNDSIVLPSLILDNYVGTYKIAPAWYVTISRNENQLIALANGGYAVPMKAKSDSVFWIEDYGTTFDFKRNKEGKITHLIFYGMTCKKVEEKPVPTVSSLTDFVGEYYSKELQTQYSICIKDGSLIAKNITHGDISLQSAWKDDFKAIWFINSLEFYRNKNGIVLGFKVSHYRSRNQDFKKMDRVLPGVVINKTD